MTSSNAEAGHSLTIRVPGQSGIKGATPYGTFPKWAFCVICFNTKNTDVVYEEIDFYFLPCLHMICSAGCLNRLAQYVDPLACPKCKVKFTENMVTRKPIRPMQILDKDQEEAEASVVNIVICTYCLRGDEGVTWCIDCGEFLCQNCTDHHTQAKSTHDHSVSKDLKGRKNSVVEPEPSQKGCLVHRGIDLTTYCETCEVKLCNLCISTDPVHAEHSLKGIVELVSDFKKELETNSKKCFMMARIAKLAEADIKEKINHVLKTEKEYLINEAAAQFSILLSTLMNREMTMRKEITELTVTKAKLLNIKRAKLKSIMLQSFQYNRLVRDVSANTSDENLLQMRSIMKSQFHKLQTTANIVVDKSNYSTYCEQGHHFMMEKQVCNAAERHLLTIGKCTYAYNPNSRVHQKLYKNIDCIKRSVELAQANAAAAAAVASSSSAKRAPTQISQATQFRIINRPTGNPLITNSAIRPQSNVNTRTGPSIQPRVGLHAISSLNVRNERPVIVARRAVAVKRTGGAPPRANIQVRNTAVVRTQEKDEFEASTSHNFESPANDAEAEGAFTVDNEETENDDLFTMEAVEVEDEDVDVSNGYCPSPEQDSDSANLVIDEQSDQSIDQEQVHVNEAYMPFGETENDEIEDMYIDESNDNDNSDPVPLEGDGTTVNTAAEEMEEEHPVVVVKLPATTKSNDLIPIDHAVVDEDLPPVIDENEDFDEERSQNVEDLEDDFPSNSNAEDEEEYDEQPPFLSPPIPIPQGRRTSRKAQLSADLRTEDEMIEFEVDTSTLNVSPVDKVRPELVANHLTRPRENSDLERLSNTAEVLGKEKIVGTPGQETRAAVLASPDSDVPPPQISPCSDTVSGKRERKVKKIDPEFLDPDDQSLKSLRRKTITPRRDSSPHKASTSKSSLGSGLPTDYVAGDDSSASSGYSNENRKKKAKKSGGFLGRSNRKRKAAKKTSVAPSDLAPVLLANEPAGQEGQLKFPLLRDENMKFTNTDDNEDYCAVCRDGGEDIMICCDNCPKVFHLKCHMPAVDDVPPDDWQCNWCKSKEEACKPPPINTNMPTEGQSKLGKGIMQKPLIFHTACKFLCEVFKLDECLSIRLAVESVGSAQKIDTGLHLHKIRQRLTMGQPKPFKDITTLVITLRKMINLVKTNTPPSIGDEYAWIKSFEDKFDNLLSEYFPDQGGLTHETPLSY